MITLLLLFYFLASVNLNDAKRHATKTTYNNSFSADDFEAILSNAQGVAGQAHSHKTGPEPGTVFSKNSFQPPPFCTPLQLNLVVRHGIRNPGHKDIHKVDKLYQKFLDSTSKDRLHHPGAKHLYGEWKPTFTAESEKDLSPLGIVEVKSIASRFQQLFPNLLRSDTSKLLLISSDTNRTRGTCEAFHEVLRGPREDFQQKLDIRHDIIRFFDRCPKYTNTVEKSKEAMKEFHKFKESVHYDDMAKRMFAKLNISNIKSDIKAMYIISAVEEAVHGSSLWSALLDKEDLQVLEYAKDLKNYWKKGYGHAINYEHSCPLLADIMHHMEEAVSGHSYKDSIVRCSHAETILPLIPLLGIFKDTEPLRADNFNQQHDRAFATSKICPFSANLALVLYQCDENTGDWNSKQDTQDRKRVRYPQWPAKFEQHMVQLLYNELPVQLPFCDYDLCPYSLVKQHYGRIAKKCNFEEICEWTDHEHKEL